MRRRRRCAGGYDREPDRRPEVKEKWVGGFRLGPRPVVTAAVTDANVLAAGYTDLNFVEFAVGGHIRRLVGHQVLLAQFPFELREGLIKVFHIFGDEGAPAGRLTKPLQRLPVDPVSRRVADPFAYKTDSARRAS